MIEGVHVNRVDGIVAEQEDFQRNRFVVFVRIRSLEYFSKQRQLRQVVARKVELLQKSQVSESGFLYGPHSVDAEREADDRQLGELQDFIELVAIACK